MTTLAREAVEQAYDKTEVTPDAAHHTNVFVLLQHTAPRQINAVFGPFRSHNAAKDWGLVYSQRGFTIMEIMRPIGVEAIGFIDTTPTEPTLEDQGIHEKQSQIGDYIDPDILRK